MKTSLKLLGISLLFFSSCTDEELFANVDDAQKIIMAVEDFECINQSRTTLTPTDDGATFKWSANDTVGIFPETGSQIAFPMTSGAGTNTATFTGGGWALKTSTPYMAYYPMVGKFYLDKTNIPVNYTGQHVTANASTEHLGKYDYMTASATTPSANASAVNFQFKHLGALIRLKVTMKETSTLTYATLQTDEDDFITSGYIDLTAESLTINAYQRSKSFQIGLNNISVEANEDLIIYFLMPPVDLSNKTLKAVIRKDNGYYQEVTLTGTNFEAGKPYELTATIESEVENPTIVNVETAGTFESTIYNKYYSNCYNLTSLKVTGNLNGTDIRFLRKMAGRKEDGTETSGKLAYLDLTEANIVSGGDYYYMTKLGDKYYTENNVAGDYMFYFCNLKTIKFPLTITKLGDRVCSHSPQPQGNENITDEHIGTFTSIIIPTGVTTIGKYAFAWNQNLASIEIPNTVKNIGNGYPAFYRCDALVSINIPNSVESCPNFNACFGLKNLRLSENPKFTYIGSAFIGCNSLTSLTIPANIETISSYAFGNEGNPSALKEIHFKSANPPSLDENSFLPKSCKIYVPSGSYSKYSNKTTYKNYTIIEE